MCVWEGGKLCDLLVLLKDPVEIAPARRHVAPDPPRETHVGVGVDEDLEVEEV